jgi:hypothetical protein
MWLQLNLQDSFTYEIKMTHEFDAETVLEGARSIRPHLPALLGDRAPQVDARVADLLAQAKDGQTVDKEILALLKHEQSTYYWIAEYLSSDSVTKGFAPLPGKSGPITAPKFVCPEGDYVWYQRSAGTPVPDCPTHGKLIPAPESE